MRIGCCWNKGASKVLFRLKCLNNDILPVVLIKNLFKISLWKKKIFVGR